jgi:hypothetical protein
MLSRQSVPADLHRLTHRHAAEVRLVYQYPHRDLIQQAHLGGQVSRFVKDAGFQIESVQDPAGRTADF